MKKLIYLIVVIAALGLIVSGCLPVVPPTEQGDLSTLTKQVGVNYYVNASIGNDSRTAEEAKVSSTPWLTIQHAVDTVPAESTINVAPGTYHETHEHGPGGGVAVDIPWFAEGAGGLTIQSTDGPENTIIDCDMGGTDGWAAWGVQMVSNNITFTGFTVKNAYSVINQVSGKGHNLNNLIITDFVNYGLGIYGAHDCTFSNITIHTNDVSKSENRAVKGIDIQEYGSGGNTYNTFQDITIYDIITTGDWGASYGISWEGDDAATHPSNYNSFTDLTIHDINGSYFARGLYLIAKETNAIENTTFSGGSVYNVVDNVPDPSYSWGIYVRGGVNILSISEFNVTNCNKGIYVSHSTYPPSQNIDINFNDIYGNTEYGVQDYNGDNDVDATCNWWGDDSGPSGEGPGTTGDKVSTNVDYNPWLTKTSSLVYTGAPQPVNLVVLKATLSDSMSTGISGMYVDFYLEGEGYVGNGITDENGVASKDIGPREVGIYEVYAKTACDLTSETEYLAVYDPLAGSGFVTGGGWIDSPAGASTQYSSAVGKASFGFVSKYKKGQSTPTGNTEFQFKAGNLNFHSDNYDWLVVAGGGGKAMYKGTGTVNGADNFGFMLSAIDSDPDDKFRIKIWDKGADDAVIYDNGCEGPDGTVLGGGQIIIHKGK